jgi:Uri superfamily endonuclease
MSWDVYKIENKITGHVYIGCSVFGYEYRFERHVRDLKAGRHHSSYLQRAWDKYGASCFQVSLLGTSVSEGKEELLRLEQRFIEEYKSYERDYGYNLCRFAASPYGREVSSKTRKKMSSARLGFKASEETKDKQSALKVKLTRTQVLGFMNEYWVLGRSLRSISKQVGLGHQHLSEIVNGKLRYTKEIYKDFLQTNEVRT